jgi:hypothetical protein
VYIAARIVFAFVDVIIYINYIGLHASKLVLFCAARIQFFIMFNIECQDDQVLGQMITVV